MSTEGRIKVLHQCRARLDLLSLYLSTSLSVPEHNKDEEEATMFYWKHPIMMQNFTYQFSEHIKRSYSNYPNNNFQISWRSSRPWNIKKMLWLHSSAALHLWADRFIIILMVTWESLVSTHSIYYDRSPQHVMLGCCLCLKNSDEACGLPNTMTIQAGRFLR